MKQISKNQDVQFHTKINAARIFSSMGIDLGNTVILDKNAIGFVSDILNRKFKSDEKITIRAAREADLGLPVIFMRNGTAAHNKIQYLLNLYPHVLIQKYIEIAHSFEVLILNEKWRAEHVPGVWESSESVPPDIIMCEGNTQVEILTWSDVRTCRYSNFGNNKFNAEDKWNYRAWKDNVEKISCFVAGFRPEHIAHLPIIVHFVIDEGGEWRFLNIRDGKGVNFRLPTEFLPYYIVRSLNDLSLWDGGKPILLDLRLGRGGENSIFSLAEALPRGGVPVYVASGVLSHPAIVLRSFGINIQSAWQILRGDDEKKGYQRMSFQFDVDSEPVGRIFCEPEVVKSEVFHVVQDREPIAPGHLLLVTKRYVSSIADAGLGSHLKKLVENKPLSSAAHWIVWERGRAQFCSSHLTNDHAHCHFLPLSQRILDLGALFPEMGAREFSDLPAALEHAANVSGEYLLLSTSGGQTFLFSPTFIGKDQKRLVRSRLVSWLQSMDA